MHRVIASLMAMLGIVIGSPAPTQACYSANQVQLYPLGVAKGSLIALLLDKSYGGNESETLSVTAELVRVTGKRKPKVVAKLGRYKVVKLSFDKTLRPALKKALKRAKLIRGFKRIRMTRWTTCEHKKKCAGARVTTASKKLGVKVGKKQKNAAWALSGIYRRPGNYTIASVRRFVAGNAKWVVVDLRAGNPRCSSIIHLPSSRSCARPKQIAQKPDGRKLTLRANSSPYHHGWDIAVAIRLR